MNDDIAFIKLPDELGGDGLLSTLIDEISWETEENLEIEMSEHREINITDNEIRDNMDFEGTDADKKVLRHPEHPLATISQQHRIFYYLRTPGHTLNDLFQDEAFQADMQDGDQEKWQKVYTESNSGTNEQGKIENVFIACNRAGITKIVKGFLKQSLAQNIPFDTRFNVLNSAGEMGLRTAIGRFDVERTIDGEPVNFFNYAQHYIRNNIQREIQKKNLE